jgi:hypothetical protein
MIVYLVVWLPRVQLILHLHGRLCGVFSLFTGYCKISVEWESNESDLHVFGVLWIYDVSFMYILAQLIYWEKQIMIETETQKIWAQFIVFIA